MDDFRMFSLEIGVGNDAMNDAEAVADALERIARKLREGYTSGPIIDTNGNTVGDWSLA